MLVAVSSPIAKSLNNEGEMDHDFSMGNLLDTIDFDDLFMGINDGDFFSHLELDSPLIFPDSELAVPEKDKSQPSSATSKSNHELKSRKSMTNGKKKPKVDWTPELHRRFVQAVEQLGLDKAVPSKILELMGNDCLTRHNVASHLQKYRSHRKHLLAREAEAASWNQRRQMLPKDHVSPWIAPPPPQPTIGFPPPVNPMSHFRPLHVWGHPSVDQSIIHTWPKHANHPPPPSWPPALPDPPFWVPHHHVPSPGTPCFPPRYPPNQLAGIPSQPAAGYGVPAKQHGQAIPQPPSDIHPSKESVDAAIGDALSKPWLPLPLGLKPPSVDSVMMELQRQGIPKIPPPPI